MSDLPREFKSLRLSNPLLAAPIAVAIGIGTMWLLYALLFYEPYRPSHEVGTALASMVPHRIESR